MALLIASLVFVCVAFVVMAVLGRPRKRDSLQQRITSIRTGAFGGSSDKGIAETIMAAPFSDRVIWPALRSLAAFASRFTPAGDSKRLRLLLNKAGNPSNLGPAEFIGIRALSTVLFTLIAFLLSRMIAGDNVLMRGMLIFLLVVTGMSAPESMLSQMIAERKLRIVKSLPDTIDLLIVSVEAGLGFDGAVARIVQKIEGPLSDELRRVLDEMRLGLTRSEALRAMCERVEVDQITTFVAAITQADQLGIGIANVLRVQSESIRQTRVQRIREAAGKLPVKMMFPLVFFIFPALFVVLLGPAMLGLMHIFNK